MNRKQIGFTLIELLIVIVIVGILAAGATVAVSPLAQIKKARDARRQTDLQNIRNALEIYYNDHGAYPVGGAGSDRSCWVQQQTGDLNCNPLGALLLDKDMSSMPYDPGKNTYAGFAGCGGAQFYSYWSNGKVYLLGAVLEAKGASSCTQNGNWNGPTSSNYTYQFYLRNDL